MMRQIFVDVQELIQHKKPREWNVSEFCSQFFALTLCGEKSQDTRECVRTVCAHVNKCEKERVKEFTMDEQYENMQYVRMIKKMEVHNFSRDCDKVSVIVCRCCLCEQEKMLKFVTLIGSYIKGR